MSIEKLIEKSFNDLIKAITTDGTSSQLIFPCYRDGNERRSEQELRQIVFRHVEEDKDKTYFYSIETPTKYVYCISNSEKPIGKENHETGDHHRSGNYDVTLYSENKIESLVTCIEFKHGYQDEEDICKDFLKLAKEVKLTKEIVDPEDIEMLQDLILTATNEALRKVDEAQAQSLGKYNIPGLM